MKCLRKWLREMESRLQPLSFHINWTLSELEEKAVEHMVSKLSYFIILFYIVIKLYLYSITLYFTI